MVYLNKKGGINMYYGSSKKMSFLGKLMFSRWRNENCRRMGDVDNTEGAASALRIGNAAGPLSS